MPCELERSILLGDFSPRICGGGQEIPKKSSKIHGDIPGSTGRVGIYSIFTVSQCLPRYFSCFNLAFAQSDAKETFGSHQSLQVDVAVMGMGNG